MIQSREFRIMCKEVASEFPDLTTEEVMEMVKDAFKFAQNHISEGSLTPIYFQYLGRFRVKEGRRRWREENRKRYDSTKGELSAEGYSDSTSKES